MPNTEKAEKPVVKPSPRSTIPNNGPVGLGAGLESPRSPHC